ncbi:MAG TPA: hypothetical protein VF376_09870 [Thermoanaerobaculia bacterium]
MNPIGEQPRENSGVRGDEPTRGGDGPAGGKMRPSRDLEPPEARRAVIDQFCDRFAHGFDKTVVQIESILGVRSKTAARSGRNPTK